MPVYTLEQPPKLNVFGHCYLISRLTKMIRTILESADHAEKVAKTFGASKWLRHTLKMRYAKKVIFFKLLDFTYRIFWDKFDEIFKTTFFQKPPMDFLDFGHFGFRGTYIKWCKWSL